MVKVEDTLLIIFKAFGENYLVYIAPRSFQRMIHDSFSRQAAALRICSIFMCTDEKSSAENCCDVVSPSCCYGWEQQGWGPLYFGVMVRQDRVQSVLRRGLEGYWTWDMEHAPYPRQHKKYRAMPWPEACSLCLLMFLPCKHAETCASVVWMWMVGGLLQNNVLWPVCRHQCRCSHEVA